MNEWISEPDKVQWVDPLTNLDCLIVRNRFGALCGYVGVSPGDSFYGQPHEDVQAYVHGGLTYSGKCSGEICHVAEPGRAEDIWWFGFDCGHAGDISPKMPNIPGSTYKNLAFVKAQVETLATFLASP